MKTLSILALSAMLFTGAQLSAGCSGWGCGGGYYTSSYYGGCSSCGCNSCGGGWGYYGR